MKRVKGEAARLRDDETAGKEIATDNGQRTTDKTKSAMFDRRPWGTFTVLDEGANYKVKRIEVLSGKRLSYQKHAQRAEHWFVVQGVAKVTLDGKDFFVRVGEDVDIEIGTAHRVENEGDETLIFIEVQRGDYLGEDDIVRLQDDYGRVGK
jgi:mannose-6-phosphate isomerase-like protein (cupin superfamily)